MVIVLISNSRKLAILEQPAPEQIIEMLCMRDEDGRARAQVLVSSDGEYYNQFILGTFDEGVTYYNSSGERVVSCEVTGQLSSKYFCAEVVPSLTFDSNNLCNPAAPATIDTSDWVDYVNLQYNFSMKIPPEWQEIRQHGGWRQFMFAPDDTASNGNFSIYLIPRKEDCDTQCRIEQLGEPTRLTEFDFYDYHVIEIYKQSYGYDKDGQRELLNDSMIIVEVEPLHEIENFFYFGLSTSGERIGQYDSVELIYTILSTFQFLE